MSKKGSSIVSEKTNILKRRSDKKLFETADKFLDVRAMFPNKKIDLRKGLTKWQREKINSELRAFTEIAGDIKFLEKDFAPIVRTKAAKEYMARVGLPKNSRGVLLQGASKTNKKITIKNGALHISHDKIDQLLIPLDALTEKTLTASVKRVKKLLLDKKRVNYLGTHGGKIHNSGRTAAFDKNADEIFLDNALTIFNKYVTMTHNEEKRDNGRYAAHPSKWGMVLISENKDAYEAREEKTTAKKNDEKKQRRRKNDEKNKKVGGRRRGNG